MLRKKIKRKKRDVSIKNFKKKLPNSDSLIISGDLNARVGNHPMPNVVGTFGEDCVNRNGQTLREFASFNDLKITNTFYRGKN
jgi:hypothetical protein